MTFWILAVPCSRCHAAREERCREPSGRLRMRPHKVRRDAAREIHEERQKARSDAREAEGSGLLSRPVSDGREGSNPSPTAISRGRFLAAASAFAFALAVPKHAIAAVEKLAAEEQLSAVVHWRRDGEVVKRTLGGIASRGADGKQMISYDVTLSADETLSVDEAEVALPEGVMMNASFDPIQLGNGDQLTLCWVLR